MSGITNFVPDDALRQPSMLLPHSSKDLEAQQGILRLLIAEPIPALRSYFSQVVRKAISQDVDIIELDKSLDLATQAESLAFELLVF